MNFRKLTLIILAAGLVFTSCKKEEIENETTNSGNSGGTSTNTNNNSNQENTYAGDESQLTNFFANNISAATQNFKVDATKTSKIVGKNGTTITFWGNSFVDAAGNSVTGQVDIELIEAYGKKDMLFLNKQTLGNNNGKFSPLISGGEFKITASQNGNEVFVAQWMQYSVSVPATNGPDYSMQLFFQNSVSADTLLWEQADSSLFFGNGTYEAYLDRFGWINCDYFMGLQLTQTSVSVKVPKGLNDKNCMLYISFDGLNSLTSLYNFKDGSFNTGEWYTLPVGQKVHFIALCYINNVPHVSVVSAVITENHVEVIESLKASTIEQFASEINMLP